MEVKPLSITEIVPDVVGPTDATSSPTQQTATLRRLCEIFRLHSMAIPELSTPERRSSSTSSSVPHPRIANRHTNPVSIVSSRGEATLRQSFAALDKTQADQLIHPWLRTWMNEHPPTEPYAHFINIVHNDIRTATINSEAWSQVAIAKGKQTPDVDLYWFPVDPDIRRDAATPTLRPPGQTSFVTKSHTKKTQKPWQKKRLTY